MPPDCEHPDCARGAAPFHGQSCQLPEGASVTIRRWKLTIMPSSAWTANARTPRSGDEVRITADENSVGCPAARPRHFYRTLANYMEQNPSITGES